MIRLIYVSSAYNLFSSNELSDLLSISIKNNVIRNITGFLIYSDGNFIQVLEGQEVDVDFFYKKILNDKRHHDVIIIDRSNIECRDFESWSMGFKTLAHDEIVQITGYSTISNLKSLAMNGDALDILLQFLKNNRS
ncbi:MAG: BLUF domain-containing protein [Methylococcales bacterium]|nr:BLUF domain-containing protein [Methylococcales bacterium]